MFRRVRRGVGLGLAVLVTGMVARTALQLERTRRAQARDYRQVEALFSLFKVLEIRHPLPPMRGWALSPDLALFLVGLILERKPRCVLETGSGISTLVAAYALEKVGSGRIVSLEHDASFAAASAVKVRRHGLERFASVRHAPLRQIELEGRSWLWYDAALLDDVAAADLVLVDGPPGDTQRLARYPALPVLMPRLSPDAIVVMDDYRRKDEREIASRWLRQFQDFEAREVEAEKGAIVLSRRAPAPRRSP
jgi:predicted O-methyltransferase YrrM